MPLRMNEADSTLRAKARLIPTFLDHPNCIDPMSDGDHRESGEGPSSGSQKHEAPRHGIGNRKG
jgi:hypothetical protein